MDGERLPAALDDLLDAQAEAVRRSLGEGGAFALLGHSTGGTLAHALATRLAENGKTPAGVVLIDTHSAMTSPGFLPHVFDEMLKRDQVMVSLSDTRLTAMAAYGRMLGEYEPRDLAYPTLMVKASEPMGDTTEAGEWETTWKHAHTSHQSPGDHFTMMEEHAEHTAEIVGNWMETLDR
jgi:thioesterase domain-containing protein